MIRKLTDLSYMSSLPYPLLSDRLRFSVSSSASRTPRKSATSS